MDQIPTLTVQEVVSAETENKPHSADQVGEGAAIPVAPSSPKLAAPTGGTGKGVTSIPNPVKPTALSQTKVVSPTATATGAGVAKPQPSLAAAGAARIQAGLQIPKGLSGIDTGALGDDHQDYFHGMVYGETGARKTTQAAEMFGTQNTLIVLCRQPEQLIPLRGEGYKVLYAADDDALVFALTYPEVAAEKLLNWSEWATLPNRALVVDDLTEAVSLLLDRNSVNDEGKERKDARQIYKYAGQELSGMFKSLRRKKLHLILISLAKISTNDISNEEIIGPELPPSMRNFINTDLEFVFYIDKSKWKYVTEEVYRSYEGTDEKTGKTKLFRRQIFGKNKIPKKFWGRGVFPSTKEVTMDLAKIWTGVRTGTPIEPVPGQSGVKK